MLELDQVLVVDGSRVVRELLARLMKRHSTVTHAIDDCEKACEWITRNAALSLVIADRDAPGGGGLRLLEFVAGIENRRPLVLLIGRRFTEEERVQATLLGAIGCLTKPLSFHQIVRSLRASQERPFTAVSPRLYASPPVRAHLLDRDGQESHIVWNAHDISVNGALLDTRGPIPVGTTLALALSFGDSRISLVCDVVRVQEPAWETLPGVGVHFRELSPDDRARIEAHLRQADATPR